MLLGAPREGPAAAPLRRGRRHLRQLSRRGAVAAGSPAADGRRDVHADKILRTWAIAAATTAATTPSTAGTTYA
jgi:hypothetical protein